jgi:TIR domain
MSTTQEPHVFVSYAHANEPLVRRLIADLKVRGINAWVDKSGLEAGTPDWESALRVAISGAKAVILIASPDARASRYVKDELRIAEMYKHRIYPLWVAGTQWMDSIPMGWGGTQYIDARESGYFIAVNELAAALSGAPPPTLRGFNNGCFYAPGSGWTCRVTLQNVSTTGAFSWSTHVSMGTITLSPSAAIIPLSAGRSEEADIQIPENSCGHAVVTFKGPENSVDVTIVCSS